MYLLQHATEVYLSVARRKYANTATSKIRFRFTSSLESAVYQLYRRCGATFVLLSSPWAYLGNCWIWKLVFFFKFYYYYCY